MKTISISDAKATLSEQIRHVRRGEEVVITERGKPVARLVPVEEDAASLDVAELVGAGVIRLGGGALPRGFFSTPRPADKGATVRAAVADERAARAEGFEGFELAFTPR
ncbi:MAG: type II toxin-antitoxin system prevent-host-death family antitoxin [Deltaproteobacteria bacterium]|nr:type II toxin-antitoxin system prevent-host-death family antitoxin [Deltaproteobacteria bacterium]